MKGGKNPLEAVILKGRLEDEVEVAGDKVLFHITTVTEEQEINKATESAPLLDRDYERWIQRLSWAVTRINEHIFEDQKEALDFFKQLSQPHVEAFVEAYGKLFKQVNENLGTTVQEVKN
jgi:hypothetical protein